MTARERVGSFLLERTHGKTGVVELPMSSRDIADYLGLTIETVSRVLSKLEREGAIRKELRSRRIEVVNPDQLQSGIALDYG